ncbi:MAG: nicotinate-nucleotide adenylyltransferase [Deltaproteobacteria bacterium]|nr:nicotinate-nucleotide adenylyltransferase [Deltaproteobacteria bacterium]
MKIGILGGTFNPIHLAHLRIAEEAREVCGLDRVLFIPTSTPPHKATAGDVPFRDRHAMALLATENNPSFAVTDLENRRPGKSYSIDSLNILQGENPQACFYFILGMDSFLDIHTWKDFRGLFRLANFVTVARPGFSPPTSPRELLPVAVREEFCYDTESATMVHKSGNRLIFLQETRLDISSTRIRQLVAEKRSIKYLVTPAVEDYILKHGLYLNG